MVRSLFLAFLLLNSFSLGAQNLQKAAFAAGCFWCTEEAFEKVPGVVSAVPGSPGGSEKNPTSERASAGRPGHTGAVRVPYPPARVSSEKLPEPFWLNHAPAVNNRQF